MGQASLACPFFSCWLAARPAPAAQQPQLRDLESQAAAARVPRRRVRGTCGLAEGRRTRTRIPPAFRTRSASFSPSSTAATKPSAISSGPSRSTPSSLPLNIISASRSGWPMIRRRRSRTCKAPPRSTPNPSTTASTSARRSTRRRNFPPPFPTSPRPRHSIQNPPKPGINSASRASAPATPLPLSKPTAAPSRSRPATSTPATISASYWSTADVPKKAWPNSRRSSPRTRPTTWRASTPDSHTCRRPISTALPPSSAKSSAATPIPRSLTTISASRSSRRTISSRQKPRLALALSLDPQLAEGTLHARHHPLAERRVRARRARNARCHRHQSIVWRGVLHARHRAQAERRA